MAEVGPIDMLTNDLLMPARDPSSLDGYTHSGIGVCACTKPLFEPRRFPQPCLISYTHGLGMLLNALTVYPPSLQHPHFIPHYLDGQDEEQVDNVEVVY